MDTSWLAEDPELLRAALEIVESWDEDNTLASITVGSPMTDDTNSANDEHGEGDVDDSGDDVSAAATGETDSLLVTMRLPARQAKPVELSVAKLKSVATRDLKPSTVASTRHRRREEIIFLRDQVKEMETQLAAIESARSQEDAGDSTRDDKALTVMWHDIASRQQRLRQKSELDQIKLKKLLQTQMTVAQGLMKLMQKARRLQEDEDYPQMKRAKLSNGATLDLSEADQLAHVEQLYRGLEATFLFPKFHDGTLRFVDIKVSDDQEEEVVIEFREAWTVPFELDRVLDALWEYTLKKNKEKWRGESPSQQVDTTVTDGGNARVSRFTVNTKMGPLKATYDGRVVIKRFVGNGSDEPAAIIGSMRAEPHPTNSGDMEGIHMQDDSCIRVLPIAPLIHELHGSHITQVQCSQRFHMQLDKVLASTKEAAGILTNMLLDKLKDDMELKHETVETLLLRSRKD